MKLVKKLLAIILSNRLSVFYIFVVSLLITLGGSYFNNWPLICSLIPAIFVGLGLYDITQKTHAILRNYPIIGHMRYLIESIGPELRQYLIESDHQEVPFSRNQRSLVYQRSKNVSDTRSFGANLNMRQDNYECATHSMNTTEIPSKNIRVVVDSERKKPYSMSVLNISAMSFGALSANAVMALNKGAKLGDFAQDTGEGSVSPYHKKYAGDLIWELGSGYFGCRNDDGTFSPEKFAKVSSNEQIKMIEIKLSQGAKPGHGGVLPAAKITPEIAETRGIPMGIDCVSPPSAR